MTGVLAREPAPVLIAPRRRLAAGALPWLVPAAVLVTLLLLTGTAAWDVLRYAAYFALAILLPGTLLHRALRGSRGNLPEDLGLGGATGLLVMLAGWALVTATGTQVLLPVWPVLVVVPFLAVPALRRHWRIADPDPAPWYWSWALAGGVALVALSLWPAWRFAPLPPATANWYQDLSYHLSLVRELTRTMPFQVPEVAGDTLRYHYLSDADMAAASMVTKINPAVVLLRLWLVPIVGLTALVAAALTRELTGRWWAGALGGLTAVAGGALVLGSPVAPNGSTVISYLSPSLMYVLPLAGLLLLIAVDVVRGRRLGPVWLIVFPLALACAGGKSSALPPIVAGLVAAAFAALVWHRDRLRPTLAMLALALTAMVTGLKLFAGGGAGVLTFQPLGTLNGFAPYRKTVGAHDVNMGDRLLPDGVAHASAGVAVFIAGIVGWWVLLQAGRLAGLTMIGFGRSRRDPAAWLFAGVTVAGVGGMWLLWHPSGSQNYFFIGVIPFATVLTVWLLADRAEPAAGATPDANSATAAHAAPEGAEPSDTPLAVPPSSTAGGLRAVPPVVLYGLLAGFVWAALAPRVDQPEPLVVPWAWALAKPVLLTALVAVVVAGLVRIIRPYSWRTLSIALLAAVLGGGAGAFAIGAARNTHVILTSHHLVTRPGAGPHGQITKDEMSAAMWLDRHAGTDDVIATNVHCTLPLEPGECNARAFWVVALTGRRALVESWGYTDQAVTADGVGGLRYTMQPAPYPDRFALNERVFTEADPADVAELRTRYHVRWLFADTRHGPVSARLAQVARPVHTAGPVTVYDVG